MNFLNFSGIYSNFFRILGAISLFKIAKRGLFARKTREADVAPRGTRGGVTCRFRASLKHKDDGQTKFIKPNSQRQDILIKYWVSIGSIHREQG